MNFITIFIGIAGLEPTTLWSQTRCATKFKQPLFCHKCGKPIFPKAHRVLVVYAYPGAVFITKWISYGSLRHNLIVSFDTSTTFCHLGLDLDSNFQIVPWLDSLRGSNTYVRAYQYLLAFIKAQSSFWLSRYCALGRQTCSATMLGHHPKCNELGA